MKLSEIDPGSRIMALFKGKPGTLKSTGAASFPGRIKLLDFDRRARALLLWFKDREEDIDIVQFSPYDFEKMKKEVEPLIDNCPYSTVIADSLMPLARMCINYTMAKTRAGDAARGKKIGIMDMPGLEDYGGETRGLSTFLDLVRNLPCHFILIAHILEFEDAANKRISQTLLTGGKKIAAEIPIYFDEIWHFETKSSMQGDDGGVQILTQAQNKDFARTALGLSPVIDFPREKRLWPMIVADCKKRGINIEKDDKGQIEEKKIDGLQG